MKKSTDDMRVGVSRRFPISPSLFVAAAALVLTFVLEILSRRSLSDAAVFLISKPHLFLYGASIVSVTLAVGMLFRKKYFSETLIAILWLAFGVSNCILLAFRGDSPLTAVDLQLGLEAITMMPSYFAVWQIALIAAAVIGVVTGLVLLGVKSPAFRRDWQKSALRLLSFGVVFLVFTLVLFAQDGVISRSLRPSLYRSYKEYGFPYCFSYSFFDVGIRKPKNYSADEVASISSDLGIEIDVEDDEDDDTFIEDFIESVRLNLFESEPEGYTVEAVNAIRELLRKGGYTEPASKPNVVFVQLESFFDPTTIKPLSFSADPIPNFRALCDGYTTGLLSVPTVSGGTANTEFEVLTGCSLDFFGAGEFPYYSILRKNACETLATDLRALGYTATGVHNYTGSFYYRNTIYENMGFNRFISQEYMNGFETNLKGWAKDAILPGIIARVMDETEGSDFVYTVTMQTHGSYLPLPEGMEAPIAVSGEMSAEYLRTVEYFVSQLTETDAMIGDLVAALSARGEDTIVVFFGDHLPSLELEEEELSTNDLYATRYVIWDNMGLAKNDRDIEAYQLGSWAMKQIGNDMGLMVRFHQIEMDQKRYQKNLGILEYDMLYGDRIIYGGNAHSYENRLEMGLDPIRVTGARGSYGNLFVEGENFTYASKIYVDDDPRETVFVTPSLLISPGFLPEDGAILSVAQVSAENVVLSRTEERVLEGLVPPTFAP